MRLQGLERDLGTQHLLASRLIPAPDGLGVEMLGVVEHDVGFQRLVRLFLAAGGFLTEVLLEIRGQRRQEGVPKHPAVCSVGGRLELAALVETEAPRPGHGSIRRCACLGESAHTGQRRQ